MVESDLPVAIPDKDALKLVSTLAQILKILANYTDPHCSPDDDLTLVLDTTRRSNRETFRLKALEVFLKPEDRSRVFDPSWLKKSHKDYELRWGNTESEIAEIWKSTDMEGLLGIINEYNLRISVEVDEEGTSFYWQWSLNGR